MKLAVSSVAFCTTLALPLVNALSFPIFSRRRSAINDLLARRAIDMGTFGNGSEIVMSNGQDTAYFANISLAGKEFQVLIDTGSSDLWVVGGVPGAKNLSIESGVNYAVGSAKGFINTADLQLGDHLVKDQAFIDVVEDSVFPDTEGLIGLGPGFASGVRASLDSSSGNPPLDRIFRQNMSTPNFISVLLTREEDILPGGTAPQTGQLTIGSIIPTLEGITEQKKLPALFDAHWKSLLDENGIIGPDGDPIITKTTVPDPKEGTLQQLRVIFDTGYSFPQVPVEIADAIYGRVPRAVFHPGPDDSQSGTWAIPCDYELNITFVFGGVKYPINPIDMAFKPDPEHPIPELNGLCAGTFQSFPPAITKQRTLGPIDAVLGMAFLRNVYLLIDFGDFVDGSNSSVADPYIQLLSITNMTAAHTDFVNARLGGVDTTGSQPALLSESEAKHSQGSASNRAVNSDSIKSVGDRVKKAFYKTAWFIVIVAVSGAVLLALVAWIIFSRCRRRRSNVRSEPAFTPAMGEYAPLRETVSRPEQGHYIRPSRGADAYQSGGHYKEPKYGDA